MNVAAVRVSMGTVRMIVSMTGAGVGMVVHSSLF